MPSDPRDYKLDLSQQAGTSSPGSPRPAQRSQESSDRPFLQALFTCCNIYTRIYRRPAGDRYVGACPRCGKRVQFVVGPGGTTSRSFVIE